MSLNFKTFRLVSYIIGIPTKSYFVVVLNVFCS